MTPTRKIRDINIPKVCRHPEHNPPMHWCPEPGVYEHTCPSCGHVVQFVVAQSQTQRTPDDLPNLPET